ncbi:MAG: alginate export family protein [Methylophagaceae bacterium]
MKKLTLLATAIGALITAPTVTMAEDAFIEALSSGKVSFSARLRYESVEQDNALKDADAFTIRTTLGYKTGGFHGFSAFAEVEDVTELGSDNYNSTTNGESAYSVIADPDGTEINQAYLQYNGFNTEFKFGRQEITYRKAPFHRFVGTVLWRQNHQSFDALSISNASFENTTINYAYIDEIHTIFGDDRDVGTFIKDGDIDLDGHLVNIQYTGLPIGKLEGYGYFLDYNDKEAISSQTLGLRLSGAQPLNENVKIIYTAEYANQDDYKDGTMDDQSYYLAELGAKYNGWLAKASYEMQEGDGTDSFKTPLGTNHAFQGWADQFLATPAQGLRDIYFTVVGKVLGAKVVVVYHDFETDKGSLDAGDELDILVQKTFKQHYTVGVKYSDYDADSEFAAKVDTEKFWLFGQIKF